jgi:cytochrome c oxidase subunit I+III
MPMLVAAAAAFLALAFASDLYGQLHSGLRPNTDSYAALTFLAVGLQGGLVVLLVIAAGYVIARYFAGMLDADRRLTFETVYLLWIYTVGQGLLGLLLTYGFPRLVAA